ncbi:MAG: Minf_1886 family protein [Akkermansia sp.]
MQQNLPFELAVQAIVLKHPEFAPAAYAFVHDALMATTQQLCQDGRVRHLSADELYFGACMHAIKTYGPLADVVLSEWGVMESKDIGSLVYYLIEAGVFGKQKDDAREQFDDLPCLQDLLNRPFSLLDDTLQ